MRTLMIPASFITVYGLILVSLTMALAPGGQPGPKWQATCYNASVAALPPMLAPSRSHTYQFKDFDEERVEESLH